MATAWRLQCIAFGLVVASSVAAHATDIYVDNLIGDDRSSGHSPQIGTSASGPVRSLTRALQLARAGDRIVMAKNDEPYRESVTLQGGRHSGSPRLPLTIEGNGAVLEGRGSESPREWEYVGDDTYRFTPNWRSFPLLYLGEKPAARKRVDESGIRPALGPLEWCSYKGEVLFRAEPGRIPVEYPLTAPMLSAGLTLYDVRHVVVQDLVVQGYRLDGINCHDNAADVRLVGITARGNGRSGVHIGGASRVSLEASLIGDNGAAQLSVEGRARVQVDNCNLLENTAPAQWIEGAGRIVIVAPAE